MRASSRKTPELGRSDRLCRTKFSRFASRVSQLYWYPPIASIICGVCMFPLSFHLPLSGIGAFHSSPTNTSNHGPGGPSAAAHHQPRDYQPQYMSHRYHQYASQPHLPQCHAPGCSKPVHCDFSLPESLRNFNYCSPQCRDIDLLPAAKTTLTSELEVLKGELQAAAATDVSSNKPQVSKNPSFEHSSSNSGMSNKFSWISLGGEGTIIDILTPAHCT